MYGPITTIHCNGHIKKKIPWSAFTLTDQDWKHVKNARDILKVSVFGILGQILTNLY
jgi:hypothetical protein